MPSNLYPRNGIWWARLKVRGIEYRESLRTRSEVTAKKRLKALREEIENKAHFGIAGPQTWEGAVVSWDAAMDVATRSKAISVATIRRYKTSLRECRTWLDGRQLHTIDQSVLREMVKGRQAQRVTNATIRRDLTAISSVLEHAIDEDWIEHNAAAAYPRKRIAERRDPIVLPTEVDIAFTVGPKHTRLSDMMLFARETGMRQEEIAGLSHKDIDLRTRQATFVGKRNRLRSVPLSDNALSIIKRQPRNLKAPWIFWHLDIDANGDSTVERYKNVASNFADMTQRAAARAAKEKPPRDYRRFRFHDLRHLFAVEFLRDRKGSIYDLQKLLGHTSIKTTEIYLDFLTPEQAAEASGISSRR